MFLLPSDPTLSIKKVKQTNKQTNKQKTITREQQISTLNAYFVFIVVVVVVVRKEFTNPYREVEFFFRPILVDYLF